jgi:hypothetical protein
MLVLLRAATANAAYTIGSDRAPPARVPSRRHLYPVLQKNWVKNQFRARNRSHRRVRMRVLA